MRGHWGYYMGDGYATMWEMDVIPVTVGGDDNELSSQGQSFRGSMMQLLPVSELSPLERGKFC